MINLLLKAKHWQIFLLTFGIPFGIQLIMMIVLFGSLVTESASAPDTMFVYMRIFPVLMGIFSLTLFLWFWSVAIGLQSKIPEEAKMNVKLFKVFFFIPMIYILFFVIYFMIAIESGGPNPMVFAIIFPLHLFSMFCMFYSLYFVARTIKTVELHRKVTFGDFAGEFFLIWFYPIGIWFVQPKINAMVADEPPSIPKVS